MADQQWVTMQEAAKLAKVTERTIRKWIDKGAVEKSRANAVARRVLVRREDVEPSGKRRT